MRYILYLLKKKKKVMPFTVNGKSLMSAYNIDDCVSCIQYFSELFLFFIFFVMSLF